MHIKKKTSRLYCCDKCDFKSHDVDHVKDHEMSNHTSVKELTVCDHELYWFNDIDIATAWFNDYCTTTGLPNYVHTNMVSWWNGSGWYELIICGGVPNLKPLEHVLADLDDEAAKIQSARQALAAEMTKAMPQRKLKPKKPRVSKR